MNVNELRAKRAAVIIQAEDIIKGAEAAGRELTAEEMTVIDGLVGVEGDPTVKNEVAALDAQIAHKSRVSTLKDALALRAEEQNATQRPEGTNAAQTMKRADWERLTQGERAAFVSSGGKLAD